LLAILRSFYPPPDPTPHSLRGKLLQRGILGPDDEAVFILIALSGFLMPDNSGFYLL